MFPANKQAVAFFVQPPQTAVSDVNQLRCRVRSPGLDVFGDACRSVTTLVGFNEGGAQIAITLFGDAKTIVLAARRIFTDIHADPGDELPWVGEALDVTDFSNHG